MTMKALHKLSSLVFAMTLASAQHASAETTWNLATGYRAESFHTRNIDLFVKDVDEATKGALKIKVHPNNSLHKLAEIPPAVESGKTQAGEVIMTGLVKDIPLAGADSVPFIARTYSDAKRLWTHQKPLVEKHFEKRGLKPLFAVAWPPQGLYSIKPITTPADFKGTQMRTYNATTVRIAELLGAKPVEVPMIDVGKALADGKIDNMITSAVTGVENQVWKSIKYYYEINGWYPKNIVFVNKAAFDALPEATRKAVMAAASKAETRGWAMSEEAATSSTNALRQNGIKIELASAEVNKEIKRLGERFSREWVNTVGIEANNIFIPYYTGAK
jgi:TRAP-type transport system periplasmic protein